MAPFSFVGHIGVFLFHPWNGWPTGNDVDVLRLGLEVHPFMHGESGSVIPVPNIDMMNFVLQNVAKHELRIKTDPVAIRHFVSTEGRVGGRKSVAPEMVDWLGFVIKIGGLCWPLSGLF